jgi:large subunit ribosomal protein L3
MKAIYGQKLGMTRYFTSEGKSVAATVLQVGPGVVHQVKTKARDGYSAIQVGLGQNKQQRFTRAEIGHLSKAEKGMPKFLAEIRVEEDELGTTSVGDVITMGEMFPVGKKVDVVGTSIGKGFAGVMKRHGMAGFPASHGTHEYFRHGGSIGNRKFPGRVFKNKRMPGHMGMERVSQLGLRVIGARPEENLLIVQGSIPGPKNGYVLVRESVK